MEERPPLTGIALGALLEPLRLQGILVGAAGSMGLLIMVKVGVIHSDLGWAAPPLQLHRGHRVSGSSSQALEQAKERESSS